MNELIHSRKTNGICPKCLRWVESCIVERDNEEVYLERTCPEDGISSILLSRHAKYFFGLQGFYLMTHHKIFPQTRYLLYLTPKCNLSCPICFLDNSSIGHKEFDIDDIGKILQKNRNELILFGAEPTCHKDLIGIIKYLKNKQYSVSLYTNGLKLLDVDYYKLIQGIKVHKLYFQFDGFNEKSYEVLRGRVLLNEKIRALDNLKSSKTPVVLDVTIAKGVNQEEIGKIFDYALENRFIKAINFIAYVRSGSGESYLKESYLMPDEIIDYIVEYTKGKISRESIYVFQKLLYSYMSLLHRRTCFYIQYFWVYRTKGKNYISMDKIINLKLLEEVLDNYSLKMSTCGSFRSFFYLFTNIPRLFLTIKNLFIFCEWLVMVLAHMLRIGEYANRSNKFLQLIFATACDPYKADLNIAKRCHVGMIFKDASGKILVNEENSFYLLNRKINNK